MWLVAHHKNRRSEGRLIAPPSSPSLVGPLVDRRPELPTTHDLGSDALAPQAGQGAVKRERRVYLVDPVDGPAVEPLEQPLGPPNRGLEGHPLAGRVAVEGDIQVMHSGACHGDPLSC